MMLRPDMRILFLNGGHGMVLSNGFVYCKVAVLTKRRNFG